MPRPWLQKTHAETIRRRGSAARNSRAFETLSGPAQGELGQEGLQSKKTGGVTVPGTHAGTQIADDVLTGLPPDDVIFGRSAAMRPVRDRVERVAQANIPVLIREKAGRGRKSLQN